MISLQKEDLLIEWNLYSKGQQAPIINEFKQTCNDGYSQEDILNFHKFEAHAKFYARYIFDIGVYAYLGG